MVIVASNSGSSMDEAFARKFEAVIHFAMPSLEERLLLWQNAFSGSCTLHPEIDLCKIAQEYEVTGGAIINVLRYCLLSAIRRNDSVVTKQELMIGIKRELKKETKTFNAN